jgi:hypothetical protein
MAILSESVCRGASARAVVGSIARFRVDSFAVADGKLRKNGSAPSNPATGAALNCLYGQETRRIPYWLAGIWNQKFCHEFRETIEASGVECTPNPARSPNLNAHEECESRFALGRVQSIRLIATPSGFALMQIPPSDFRGTDVRFTCRVLWWEHHLRSVRGVTSSNYSKRIRVP